MEREVAAVVKGETHISRRDYRALSEMDLSDVDAVFRESHEKDYFQRTFTVGYTVFAIGHLLYAATFSRLYASSDEFQEKVQESGVPWHEVDASVHESFEMATYWKRIGLLIISPGFALLGLGLVFQPLRWVVETTARGLLPILSLVFGVVLVILFGFACSLSYLILIEGEVTRDRDEYMAETILEITDTEGYERILVSCGDKHRPGIASTLREHDWNVKERGTESRLGRVLGAVDRAIATLTHPRRTLHRLRED